MQHSLLLQVPVSEGELGNWTDMATHNLRSAEASPVVLREVKGLTYSSSRQQVEATLYVMWSSSLKANLSNLGRIHNPDMLAAFASAIGGSFVLCPVCDGRRAVMLSTVMESRQHWW